MSDTNSTSGLERRLTSGPDRRLTSGLERRAKGLYVSQRDTIRQHREDKMKQRYKAIEIHRKVDSQGGK